MHGYAGLNNISLEPCYQSFISLIYRSGSEGLTA
jgi:hypothetical protein